MATARLPLRLPTWSGLPATSESFLAGGVPRTVNDVATLVFTAPLVPVVEMLPFKAQASPATMAPA